MEFSVKKFDLLAELELTQGVVERKTTIPILSNLLFEAKGNRLSITATDLELSIRTSCDAKVKKEGSGTIPAKKLYDLVRLLPDEEIRFKLIENHWIQIISDRKIVQARRNVEGKFPGTARISARARENSGGAVERSDRQDHLCNFTRRIALHAEWRVACAEAGFDHDGRHRWAPAGDGRKHP